MSYMERQNRTKLNQILQRWPANAVCLSSWLEERGISRKLAHYYCKAGWLERIGSSAYKRPGDKITWVSGLQALQTQAGLNVHLGGKSALLFQGYTHYVPMGTNFQVYIFGVRVNKLPHWFSDYSWDKSPKLINADLFNDDLNGTIKEVDIDGVSIKCSVPERAILELIHLVPKQQSFDEAFKLMGLLTAIRPKVLQLLLEQCKSIKVKRAFMVMAEKHNYPWMHSIDLKRINFGSGKRELIKNGFLEPKYLITIPRWDDSENVEV
jgi:hypothetical protein